jgi:N-acetyl-gamma-glutamyl-phosphate reductase
MALWNARNAIDLCGLQLYALVVHKLPVGVLGASGYAGRELCSLVIGHPQLELAFATGNERAGETLRLNGRSVTLVHTDSAPLADVRLVFSCLPHGHSGVWAMKARSAGVKVVDLSSDLRPGHTNETIPYGLTESRRDEIRGADMVANPGCYPTATLLSLLPLLGEGHVLPGGTISVAAASGTTGAGSAARTDLLFSEVTADYRAYGVGNTHRHLPEMRDFLNKTGTDADILFTPHLLPVARGILATITVPLKAELRNPLQLWRDMYQGEPFIEITDELPTLRDVVKRNVVRITALKAQSLRQPTLIVLSAIDNLVKGAAGQALQNANLMLGLEETLGLPH